MQPEQEIISRCELKELHAGAWCRRLGSFSDTWKLPAELVVVTAQNGSHCTPAVGRPESVAMHVGAQHLQNLSQRRWLGLGLRLAFLRAIAVVSCLPSKE